MKKLTNEAVDKKILNTNKSIRRLGDVLGTMKKIQWQCLKDNCNHIWLARPNNILDGGSGCPKCANNIKLSEQQVDLFLLENGMLRLDAFNNVRSKIRFQCLKKECCYIWKTYLSSVLNHKSHCPNCAKQAKLTNKKVDGLLLNRPIKRIGNIINSKTKIQWQCQENNCGYIWYAIPNSILTNNTGCPNCKLKNEKLIYDILLDLNIKFDKHKNIKEISPFEKRLCFVDFYLPDHKIIIEYNGRQHYMPICFGHMTQEDANKNFEKQQRRDKYINDFCIKHNIILYEIDGRKYTGKFLQNFTKHILRSVT